MSFSPTKSATKPRSAPTHPLYLSHPAIVILTPPIPPALIPKNHKTTIRTSYTRSQDENGKNTFRLTHYCYYPLLIQPDQQSGPIKLSLDPLSIPLEPGLRYLLGLEVVVGEEYDAVGFFPDNGDLRAGRYVFLPRDDMEVLLSEFKGYKEECLVGGGRYSGEVMMLLRSVFGEGFGKRSQIEENEDDEIELGYQPWERR